MNTKNVLLMFALAFTLSTGCKKDSSGGSTVTPKPPTTTPTTPTTTPQVQVPISVVVVTPQVEAPIIVITPQTAVQPAINLRTAGNFVVLAGSLISNVPASAITGNIGLSPAAGSAITGLGGTQITGTVFTVDATGPAGSVPDAVGLTAAKGDLTTAYNEAAGRTSTGIVLLAGNIGGLTLTPGLYKSSGALEISSGDLTFDARGNANATFIIQIASSLNTTSGRKIFLTGGALASNIFWQVGTSATLGTTSVFKGNIMADQSISVNTGAAVEGRLLARIAAVTLSSNTVVRP